MSGTSLDMVDAVLVDFSNVPDGTVIRMINTGPDEPFGGFPVDFVDFERTVLRLPESKTGAKTIYLNPPAVELLAELPRIETCPECRPVIKTARDGAHTVLPA